MPKTYAIRNKKIKGAIFALIICLLLGGQSLAQPIKVFALGDSLTAGYGLRLSQAFPAQLQAALRQEGHNVEIINGGVGGDTTHNALQRLAWAMPADADAVIVQLGGNDAMRGFKPFHTNRALEEIILQVQSRDLPILLIGMVAPPNMGASYVRDFNGIFPALAKKYRLLYYPFFLEGIYGKPQFMQADGIHPTAEGIAVVVRKLLPKVKLLLARAK